MSLVGSLEDLGLGDILQIVSLAQKSGRLLLRSGAESGRILLRAGLVCGSAIKGDRDTLRALLLDGDHVPPAQFEEASRLAEDEGLSLVSAVARVTAIETETLEGWRREHAERSVMRMFGWSQGEFSFEVRSDVDPEDEELELPTGINTQYLAMEASRLRDEGVDLEASASRDVEAESSEGEPSAESPLDVVALASARSAEAEADEADGAESSSFAGDEGSENEGGEPETAHVAAPDQDAEDEPGFAALVTPAPEPSEVEAPFMPLGLVPAQTVDVNAAPQEALPVADTIEPAAPTAEAEPLIDASDRFVSPSVAPVLTDAAAPSEVEASTSPPPPPPAAQPVVVMDPELAGLEWIKASLAADPCRVHIFQQADPAFTRVRQYLVRGERPVVLVSPRIDGTLEAPTVSDLVARFRSLAPGMPVLELLCEGREVPGAVEGVTGVARRPVAPGHDPEGWFPYRPLAESLRRDVLHAAESLGAGPSRRPAPEVLHQLKALSQRLRNPQEEDVLSLVLDFSAETFERVAIFMLRDDQVLGMVGRRLPSGSEALREIRWPLNALPALLGLALVEGGGIHGDLTDPGNEGLFDLLGDAAAPAYAAPIESGGCVAALLYADAGPGGQLADTTALEIVLHEAGLALDRALLERTLKN